VLIDRNHPGLSVAAHVHEDNLAAGRLAAEHLLAMGHKRFVWWTSAQGGAVASERLKGFQDALAVEGCTCESLVYKASGKSGEWNRRRNWLGRQLIKLCPPVALFAMDDQLAAEAVEMCLECGLNVPGDVAVVGVGNIALASETSHVPITSVDNAPAVVAREGARLLDQLMNGGPAPERPVIIPPGGLVIRESSSAYGVTHPAVLQMIEHLRANLSRPFNLDALSKASGVSVRMIYNMFRSELRTTPADFLQREQLAKAKALLKAEESSISNLVESCGFGTARTMNRIFLRYEGCSPKVWRDNLRDQLRKTSGD
jgi:LacI family transcriptional regulator